MHTCYCKKEYLQNLSVCSSFHLVIMQGQQTSTVVNFYGKVMGDTKDKKKIFSRSTSCFC